MAMSLDGVKNDLYVPNYSVSDIGRTPAMNEGRCAKNVQQTVTGL